jgi:hypothetical protein
VKGFSNLTLLGLGMPLSLFGSLGCRSISSTIMDRTPSDNLVSESNGERCYLDQGAPYRGIPVVVQVPTHVDITINETLLFTDMPDPSGGGRTLVQLKPSKRQIGVDASIKKSDKLFFVDFKRPAGGTMDYTIDYGDGKSQYFKSIKYKVVDETISDINSALTTVFSTTATKSTSKANASPSRKPATENDPASGPILSSTTRTLAWKRFDINEPDFEQQLTDFVNLHVNDCNECGPNGTSHNINVHAGN